MWCGAGALARESILQSAFSNKGRRKPPFFFVFNLLGTSASSRVV